MYHIIPVGSVSRAARLRGGCILLYASSRRRLLSGGDAPRNPETIKSIADYELIQSRRLQIDCERRHAPFDDQTLLSKR